MVLSLAEYQTKLNKALGRKEQLVSLQNDNSAELAVLEVCQVSLEKAGALIQDTAQKTQNQLSIRVEDIVQMAIDTCFSSENYQFRLKFEPKRGRTEASLDLMKDGWVSDPLVSNGGGLADIESFGLRISSWSLGQTDNCIILDEPFKFLDETLKPLAGDILKELSQRLGIQFIIVTHDESIMAVADQVITVGLRKGVSRIKTTLKE